MPSLTHRVLATLPKRHRSFLLRHRRLVKFLVVGGSCFLLTLVANYALKLTVLQYKPVVAQTIAILIATVVSYVLNRQWSFRAVGRQREALLFFVVSGLAIGVNDLPLVVSRYVFQLREPAVSHFTQEVADFLSGMVAGTLLAMAFRYWAMNRFVFTDLSERGQAAAERQPERV